MSAPSTQQPPAEQEQPHPGRTADMAPEPRYHPGEVLAPVGGETLPG